MDEVDAALDNLNITKVSNYIRQNSVNFQCVTISHKEIFFLKAAALLGVYKGNTSSGVLSVDLERFPE